MWLSDGKLCCYSIDHSRGGWPTVLVSLIDQNLGFICYYDNSDSTVYPGIFFALKISKEALPFNYRQTSTVITVKLPKCSNQPRITVLIAWIRLAICCFIPFSSCPNPCCWFTWSLPQPTKVEKDTKCTVYVIFIRNKCKSQWCLCNR